MPLLADPAALQQAVDQLADWAEPRNVDYVVGAEARGFILGSALAYRLGCRLRRAPASRASSPTSPSAPSTRWSTASTRWRCTWTRSPAAARVLVHDDLLATGGTARAKIDLVEQLGAEVVGVAFVIELAFLNGRDKLYGYDIKSLIQYESPLKVPPRALSGRARAGRAPAAGA